MGWISDRHMRQGGSIGGRRNRIYPKEGAPMRKIVATIRASMNIFEPDRVEFECGHEGHAWGAGSRGRCVDCRPCKPEDVLG